MEARDKNGLTEAEFLAAYSPKDYPRPSVTADLIIFIPYQSLETFAQRKVLLIRRGGHPCLGKWALPGGFTNPNETVESAAHRELAEETGLTDVDLIPVGLFSAPNRDPRGWTMSEAYTAYLDESAASKVQAGDDAADAAWFSLETILKGNILTLAFEGPESFTATLVRSVVHSFGEYDKVYAYAIQDSGGLAFDHAAMIAKALDTLRETSDTVFISH